MKDFSGTFFGIIEQVFPPDHKLNQSKYQYEYQVVMTGDLYCTLPVRAIVMDRFPHLYNSEEIVLDKGSKVFLLFPRNNSSYGVIIGGSRSRPEAMQTTKRAVYRNRINETEYEVGDEGELSLRLRDQPDGIIGAELELTKEQVTLYADKLLQDNGIKLDRKGRKMTFTTGDWEVLATGDAKLTIAGDADIKVAGSAKITAKEVDVKSQSLKATILGNAEVKVAGKLSAKAQFIELNGEVGGVLTTETQPACYVTGIPFMGSLTVKAGR